MSMPMKIYQILLDHSGIMTTKELALRLGVKSDRLLRGKGSDMGEIERAKAYAFRVHRRLIMTTHSGIQIVDDPVVAERMISRRYVHWTHEQRSMNKDKIRIRHLITRDAQMGLFETVDRLKSEVERQYADHLARTADEEIVRGVESNLLLEQADNSQGSK